MKYKTIKEKMDSFVDESPLNKIETLTINRIFDYPLVGVALAKDPLFTKLKEPSIVGEHHLLPGEWLKGAIGVISYFLPFSEKVREANRAPGIPAKEWRYGRLAGEEFNNALRKHIAEAVKKNGNANAVVPLFDSRFKIVNHCSNWSERHAAYIAGLGTFSLSRSLITGKGCAGRYGSIIVSLDLPYTSRVYKGINDYCNMCCECVKRCPCKAISKKGKDLLKCARYVDSFAPIYGCGKCQTAVPCEARIPESNGN